MSTPPAARPDREEALRRLEQRRERKGKEETADTTEGSNNDAVVEYLSTCGIPASSLGDLDRSSLELLRQLSTPPPAAKNADESLTESQIGRVTRGRDIDGPLDDPAGPGGIAATPRSLRFGGNTDYDASILTKATTDENGPQENDIHKSSTPTTTNVSLATTTAKTTLPPVTEIQLSRPGEGELLHKIYLTRVTSDLTTDTRQARPVPLSIVASVHSDATTVPQRPSRIQLDDQQDKALEPWQRVLFERLEEQSHAIAKVQTQINALAELVASSSARLVHKSDAENNNVPTVNNLIAPLPTRPPETSFGEGNNNNNNNNESQVPKLSNWRLARMRTNILQTTHLVRSYLLETRTYRLFHVLRTEAARRPGGVRIAMDWTFMFKVFFVCIIFASRSSSKTTKQQETAVSMMHVWNSYRVPIFVLCAILFYLVQTGLLSFLYTMIVKEDVLGQIWRDEDLLLADDDDVVDPQNLGADDGLTRQRRGRRERIVVVAAAAGEDVPAPPPPQQQARRRDENRGFLRGGRRAHPMIHNPFQNTIFVGAIHHRRRRGDGDRWRNVVFDFLSNVKYLLGSFILSLLPSWRPEVVAAAPPNDDTNARIGANDVARRPEDEVDGRPGGNL